MNKEKTAVRLTAAMAEEYPVPIPAQATESEQQKRFQVSDLATLIQEQNQLQNEIQRTTLLDHDYEYKKGELLRRRNLFQKEILTRIVKNGREILVEDSSG